MLPTVLLILREALSILQMRCTEVTLQSDVLYKESLYIVKELRAGTAGSQFFCNKIFTEPYKAGGFSASEP